MRITSGGLEHYSSGAVESNGASPIELELVDDEGALVIVVSVEKKDGEERRLTFSPESSTRLNVVFVNTKGSLNFGQGPTKIGTMSKRELYASFRVNTIGDYSSFILYYSIYLGKEVADV